MNAIPFCPWHSPVQNTGVGNLFLLQGRGSPGPRNWIRVSCIVGRFFTNWAIWEAHKQIRVSENCPIVIQQMKKCLFRKNPLNMDELRQCLYPLSQDLFLSFTDQHDKSLLWVNAGKNKGLILYPGVYSWATWFPWEIGTNISNLHLALHFRISVPGKNSQEFHTSLPPTSPHFSSESSTPDIIVQ